MLAAEWLGRVFGVVWWHHQKESCVVRAQIFKKIKPTIGSESEFLRQGVVVWQSTGGVQQEVLHKCSVIRNKRPPLLCETSYLPRSLSGKLP